MTTVADHYERLLAPVYLWMVGGAEAAFRAAESEIGALGIPLNPGSVVLDLGAGFGMHAIPAARRRARVTAIDTSAELLATLESLRGDLPIRTVNADLLEFGKHVSESPDVVLCMGDTITHLPEASLVSKLVREVASIQASGGLFVLSFRDYTVPLLAEQRFIPVRSDDERILTCFLEYGTSHVQVHDILTQRSPEGFSTRVGSYSKLRLAPDEVVQTLSQCGFEVRREAGPRGMVCLVARRA
jgi:2-polyprenyl-3-methyl-5-hydroxy-6-metoxy-1,4-benzoquinol methylase